MKSINIERKSVCVECIGEEYLKNAITNHSKIAECEYCASNGFVITVKSLSELVHGAMERHYELTPCDRNGIQNSYISWRFVDDWERHGEAVATVVADICEMDDRIADDVVEILSNRFRYRAVKDGEEDPYGNYAHYQEIDFRYDPLNEMWQEFRSVAKHRSRFFDPLNAEILEVMFGDLQKLHSYSEREFIVDMGSDLGKSHIWRARYAANHKDVERILEQPHQKMGPPPSSDAKNGRMNPRGISVFYGSTEFETCISEIRAPVGAYVVLACFEPLRRLKLLDLCALVGERLGGEIRMCGIAGVMFKHGETDLVAGQALIDMLDGCQHRGPDSTGFALYEEARPGELRLRFLVEEENGAGEGVGHNSGVEAAIADIRSTLEEHGAEVVDDDKQK